MKEFRGGLPQSKVSLSCFGVRSSIRVSSMALDKPSGGLQSRLVGGGRFFSRRQDLGLVPLRKADGASRFRHLRLGDRGAFIRRNARLRIIHAAPTFSSI